MNKLLIAALMLFSPVAVASTITYTWSNATVDVNGNPISPSDIAGVTIQCGTSSGTPEPVAPYTTYVPFTNGFPQNSVSVTWTDTSISQLFCSMNTSNTDNVKGPDSLELSFNPNQSTFKSLINSPTVFTIIVTP